MAEVHPVNAAFPASGPAPGAALGDPRHAGLRRIDLRAVAGPEAGLRRAGRRAVLAVTPHLPTHRPALAKTVITTAYALAEHVDRFGADRTVLFLRDPHDVWRSLSRKGYRDENGLIEEKMALYDAAFARARQGRDYDAMVAYEDLMRPAGGGGSDDRPRWPADESHDALPAVAERPAGSAQRGGAPMCSAATSSASAMHGPAGSKPPATDRAPLSRGARQPALCPRLTDFYRTRTGCPPRPPAPSEGDENGRPDQRFHRHQVAETHSGSSAPPTDKKYNVERAFRAAGRRVWKTLGEDPPIQCLQPLRRRRLQRTRVAGLNNIELITDRPLEVKPPGNQGGQARLAGPGDDCQLDGPLRGGELEGDPEAGRGDRGRRIELNFGCPTG